MKHPIIMNTPNNNILPQGYKMTELGAIPEEWEVVRLGEVANVVMGQSPPGSSYNEKGEGLPFLQGKAEFGSMHPKHIKYTTVPMKIAPKNSVLLSVRAPVGDVNIADIEYCIGRGLSSISLKNGNDIFLFYMLDHLKGEFEKEGTGSIFKAITKAKLMNLPLPIPPLPEQQKIAAVLSAVQEAKEKTEAVINAAKELKKSMMKHLFTYGTVSLQEAEKISLKETEIGLVPEDWEVVKLGKVAETYSGGTPNRNHKEYFEGEIGWLKSGELDNNYVYTTKEFITEEALKKSSAKYVENNTLLVAMYGATSGKVGLAKTKLTINQAICAIKPNIKFCSEFYFFYFQTIRDRLLSMRYGGAQPNLNQQILQNIKIPLPPLHVQQKIASILSTIDEKIQAEEAKKKALEDLFRSLLNNLMSGKIRVNHLNIA
jgi:type I restriction enzyme S subunit